MKKILLSATLIFSLASFAQTKNTQFEKAMMDNIQKLDTASSANSFQILANNFQRIGNTKQTRWEPYYYAAYCYSAIAFMSPDKSVIDPIADQADALLGKAQAIDANNSEITCLAAMIKACRITVDPMNRFRTTGQEVQGLIAKSKQEDANNPRVYLLQARMQLNTPEAFGGGKEPARKSAETALEKFSKAQPKTSLYPSWGEGQAKALLVKVTAQ